MILLKKNILLLIIVVIGIVSCEKVPNGGIPTYIKLSNPIIETDSPDQGSALHQFSDLWFETGGISLGAYEYPVTFAALVNGKQKVTINPGIKINAHIGDRRSYPIFEPFEAEYNFVAKDTLEINPVFKYRQGVNFLHIEDFESTNNFSDMQRTVIGNVNNLDGKAGIITLNGSETNKASISINPIQINEGKRVYVELSMKTDSYVGMGFQSLVDDENYLEIVVYKPADEWETNYFEITDFIHLIKEGEYNFYINIQKDEEDAEEKTYFDNFKVIQF